MREGFANISTGYHTALSLRPFCDVYFVHAWGVLVVCLENGALGISKSSVYIMDLHVRFIRISFYVFHAL